MIFPENFKNITLHKLDLLLKKIIVDIYLQRGSSEESIREISELSNKILSISKKIYFDEDINNSDLKSIESLYKIYQPVTDSNSDDKNNFDFGEK